MAQPAGARVPKPAWLLPLMVAAALLLGVALIKNIVAKAAVTGGVKAITGLGLDVDRLDVGLLRTAIGIRGMRLRNPSGFTDPVMINFPEIFVDYDLGAFLGGKVHLPEVRLNLKELTVVRNAQGELNLNALTAVQASKGAAKPTATSSKMPDIRVDRLRLAIGRVVFKDYRGGGEPKTQEFAVDIDEEYRNITNPYVLGGLVVSRALMKTSVARLTGFDIGPLQSMVSAQLSQATALAGEATKQLEGVANQTVKQLGQSSGRIKETAGQAADAGKEVVGAAADAVKKTTESLKKALPFGQ